MPLGGQLKLKGGESLRAAAGITKPKRKKKAAKLEGEAVAEGEEQQTGEPGQEAGGGAGAAWAAMRPANERARARLALTLSARPRLPAGPSGQTAAAAKDPKALLGKSYEQVGRAPPRACARARAHAHAYAHMHTRTHAHTHACTRATEAPLHALTLPAALDGQEFEYETQRMQTGKVRTTAWGATYRKPMEIPHGGPGGQQPGADVPVGARVLWRHSGSATTACQRVLRGAGYTQKVTGKTAEERLDLRATTKADKFCKCEFALWAQHCLRQLLPLQHLLLTPSLCLATCRNETTNAFYSSHWSKR